MDRNVKNLRIIRMVLNKPDGTLSKYRIAKDTKTSISWVVEFFGSLEKKKLVKKTKVLDFDKLVDYYIEIMPKLTYFDFYVKDPIALLKQSKLDYALTTYGAENYTSHQLFPSRYDIYIKEADFDTWKAMILKDGLLGKGNLRLILANDPALFKETSIINGIKIITKPQLLIDLKREGGVCLEAYQTLVKNV